MFYFYSGPDWSILECPYYYRCISSCNSINYNISLFFFLYKNMTVVLLLLLKINAHDYSTAVVLVKNFKTIPPCGNFSNHISRTFLNHSSHWFKLNDVYNGMILSPYNRGQMSISIQKRTNQIQKIIDCFFKYTHMKMY